MKNTVGKEKCKASAVGMTGLLCLKLRLGLKAAESLKLQLDLGLNEAAREAEGCKKTCSLGSSLGLGKGLGTLWRLNGGLKR